MPPPFTVFLHCPSVCPCVSLCVRFNSFFNKALGKFHQIHVYNFVAFGDKDELIIDFEVKRLNIKVMTRPNLIKNHIWCCIRRILHGNSLNWSACVMGGTAIWGKVTSKVTVKGHDQTKCGQERRRLDSSRSSSGWMKLCMYRFLCLWRYNLHWLLQHGQ